MNIDGLESMDIFKKSYVIERVIQCSLNAFLLYAFVIIIQADSMELNIEHFNTVRASVVWK